MAAPVLANSYLRRGARHCNRGLNFSVKHPKVQMAAYQYVYHMDGVSKTYPGGKKCFENIRLSFLPGVKIGVVGVNGAGK